MLYYYLYIYVYIEDNDIYLIHYDIAPSTYVLVNEHS